MIVLVAVGDLVRWAGNSWLHAPVRLGAGSGEASLASLGPCGLGEAKEGRWCLWEEVQAVARGGQRCIDGKVFARAMR